MRLLGAVSVAAMAFGVLPISPVNAAIATTDACNASIPEDGFTDTGVDGTDVEDAVDCLVAYGITTGQSGTLYGTGGDVTRGQLATFVLNVLDQADGFARPANAPDAFADDDGDTHEADINDAAALDLVKGFDDGTFGAGLPVQRDQMATYIINSLAEAGAPVAAATGDAFSDDDDSVHEGNINRLEAVDIVDGTVDGDYDPYRSVTRGTMAFFLTRTTEVLVDADLIAPFAVSNQSFTVTPAEAATKTVSASGTSNEGARSYTVSNLGTNTSVDIALFPAENVTDTSGVITFRDIAGTANQADWAATSGIFEVVNGVAVADTDGFVDNIAPASGSIVFTVDSIAGDEVIPVAFAHAAVDSAPIVTLDANDKPTAAFGIGGQLNWIPAEFAGGPFEIAVPGLTTVNKDANYFVGNVTTPATGSRTLEFDSNDSFQIGGVPTTLAIFEANLSTGDTMLTGSVYAPDPAAVSTFNLGDVSPDSPNNVLATVLTDTTIRVNWTAPTTGAPTTYNVYRAADTTPATCSDVKSAYALVTSVSGTTLTYTDTGLTASTGYCYLITALQDGDESTVDTGDSGTDDKDGDTTLPAGSVAAPQSTSVIATTDGGFPNEADATDVWRVVFSKPVTLTSAIIRVQDAGGQFNNAACSAEITCVQNTEVVVIGSTEYAIGRVLTATVTVALPIDGDADSNLANNDGILNYPLTIVNASGVSDGTRVWDPATSPDKTIEVNTLADATEDTPIITIADMVVDPGANGFDAISDSMLITFSEAVDWQPASSSLSQAQLRALTGHATVAFGLTTGVTISGACVAGGTTCTLTITTAPMATPIALTASIPGTVSSDVLDTDDGNQQQIAGANPTTL